MKRKRVLSLLLALACTLSVFTGCSGKAGSGTAEDGKTESSTATATAGATAGTEHEPLTMTAMVPFRNPTHLANLVHEKYPEINIEFQPYSGFNATAYTKMQLAADDMPDIYIGSMYTPSVTDVSDRLIDLSVYPFTDNFTDQRLREVTDNGSIYMLPLYYSCLAITYNKTLLEKNGWTLPNSLEELEELAPKVKEAGYDLAVSQVQFPGYGFQYFFNFLSAGYINTTEGRKWQNSFLAGETNFEDNEDLMQELELLQRWHDIGVLQFSGDPDSDTVTRAKMFEPFTREGSSLTNKVQGTGLGMAIAKSIVDLMGGEISVESAPGKGSRFDVTLTFDINEEVDLTVNAKAVLLISEDAVLSDNVKASMQAAKTAFVAVKTLESALREMDARAFDLILLGGVLYDADLAETVRTLRGRAANAKLIFCVDYAQSEQAESALAKSGADGLIPRPFFLSNLIQAVEQAHDKAIFHTANESILKGLRFLCAEDNELNAEILEATLAIEGASCTICHNGQEIVECFKTVKPGEYDAILMDVQMPVMNGLEATRAIRAGENPLGKTIPILAMTANAFSEDIQNSFAAGMDAHISKPLEIRVLEREMTRFVTPPEFAKRRQIYLNGGASPYEKSRIKGGNG